MARIKLIFAYVGTGFEGWQLQTRTSGKHPRTVQETLEKAVGAVLGKPVRVHGSGRTDSGVHADMQVAHFDAPDKYRGINWPAALQRSLPEDIVILSAEAVPDEFHSRFSARGKVYTYLLWQGSVPVPPKLRPFVWAVGPSLTGENISLIDEAAASLLGEHDFAAFQNSGSAVKDTIRTIHGIRRFYLPLPGQVSAEGSPLLAWEFSGNGFLKQMVRNLMGFMLACGLQKLSPADAEILFSAKDRSALNFVTAPACGLTLTRVEY